MRNRGKLLVTRFVFSELLPVLERCSVLVRVCACVCPYGRKNNQQRGRQTVSSLATDCAGLTRAGTVLATRSPNWKYQRLRVPDFCILAQPAGSVCADVGRSCALKCARCLDASSGFLSAATQLCVAEKLGAGTLGTVLLLLLLGRERTFCSFAPSASAMFMAAATLADRLVARLDATSSGTVARSTSAPCSRRLSHLAAR